jgi:hypothetical protein
VLDLVFELFESQCLVVARTISMISLLKLFRNTMASKLLQKLTNSSVKKKDGKDTDSAPNSPASPRKEAPAAASPSGSTADDTQGPLTK